jgi:type I restriction enzyme S subunit
MKFRTEAIGKHFELQKGLGYKGQNLVEESDVGLLTIDAFITGGGYKRGSEKPYDGDYKNSHVAESGDVLLAMTEQQEGLLASPLKVPEDLGGMAELIYSLDVVKAVATSGELTPEFLFNFLRVPLNRRRAAYGDTGTTVQRLPYDVIYEQLIPVPSLVEQGKINSFVRMLDRKIELNNEIVSTIEKILKTVFESWFINFEPVITKMAGIEPIGMDSETAAFFPNSMEDSELGPIPEGWVVMKVDDLLDRLTVKPLPKSTKVQSVGRTVVLEQGDSTISGFIDEVASVQASADSPKFIFGDHTCRTYLSTLPFCVFPNTIVLTSKTRNSYWAHWATRDIQKFESYRRHWMELAVRKVVVPTSEICDKWGELASTAHAQMDLLMVQSRQLAALRNALLPQLISGELRIPEEILES